VIGDHDEHRDGSQTIEGGLHRPDLPAHVRPDDLSRVGRGASNSRPRAFIER
jgi:hypothetical protein